jgi:hypothetical protein
MKWKNFESLAIDWYLFLISMMITTLTKKREKISTFSHNNAEKNAAEKSRIRTIKTSHTKEKREEL